MPVLQPLVDDANTATFNTAFAMIGTATANLSNHEGYTYRWANDAERLAQAGMRDGDEGYQVSSGFYYTYIAGAWKRSRATAAQTYAPTFTNLGGNYTAMGTWYPISPFLINVTVNVQAPSPSGSGGIKFSLPTGLTTNGPSVLTGDGFFAGVPAIFPLTGDFSSGGNTATLYSPLGVSNANVTAIDAGRLGTNGSFTVSGNVFVTGL